MIEKTGLWIFPASDFTAWQSLTGSNQVDDHSGYMDLIAATQADQERQGRSVVRVAMSVSAMRAELEENNLPNTPESRASVVAKRAIKCQN